MADSQRIATETNYENDLTDLTTQYQSTIADLQQAITSAKLAGDAQAAESMASYLSQVQAQYASYLQNERGIQAEIDMFNRQLAAQQAQAAQSYSSGGSGYSSGGGDDESAGGLSNYTAVKNNILNYATHGVVGHAKTLLQNVWGQMSTSQQQDMVNALKRLGIAT